MIDSLVMEARLENINLAEIEKLYLGAFPKSERKPFLEIYERAKQGFIDILEFKDKDFIGMAIVMKYKDIALLDYFAISSVYRAKGYGSIAIEKIKTFYRDRRLVLEIEELIESAPNYKQRLARKAFYIKNGFDMMDLKVSLFGIILEFMCIEDKIDFKEYMDMYENVFGKEILKNIKIA